MIVLSRFHPVPQDELNFLRDCKNSAYPGSCDNKPVTWYPWKTRKPVFCAGVATTHRSARSGIFRKHISVPGAVDYL